MMKSFVIERRVSRAARTGVRALWTEPDQLGKVVGTGRHMTCRSMILTFAQAARGAR